VATPKTILIAGAGIGGLTAALALADKGFRVVVLEAARELSEAGAGIQLSPNATRVLAALGLADALRPYATAPEAIAVMNGRSGGTVATIPLGRGIEARYGAPYWVVHRADLQRVLLDAAAARPAIVLRTGFSVLDHKARADGVTVAGKTQSGVMVAEPGDALVGADGLWSTVRARLGHEAAPRFRGRTAWRALIDAAAVESAWGVPVTRLWLGPDAHLVHYPVRGGAAINVVAIVADSAPGQSWSGAGDRDDLMARFARWAPQPRALIAAAPAWQTWSLHDLVPALRVGNGVVTLLGDAAHAMLPFLAQGAAMAIEDAAVLADNLARAPDDIAAALGAYEAARAPRTTHVAEASDRTGTFYHLGAPFAAARDFVMRRMGSERLAARQDWLYRWPG
jgi:salicylate hydroxylase